MVLEDLIGQFLYGSKGDDIRIVAMRQLLRQVIMKPLNLGYNEIISGEPTHV